MLEPTVRTLLQNLSYLSTVLRLPADHVGAVAVVLALLVAMVITVAARRLLP